MCCIVANVRCAGLRSLIATVREDTLTVDRVEKAENVLLWSGGAIYRPTEKNENDARPVINDAMSRVFARYPIAPR